MKTLFLFCMILLMAWPAISQEVGYLVDEGERLEKAMKDAEAIEKYREALRIAPSDLRARVKCSEMLCMIGYRTTDPAGRKRAFDEAFDLAREALKVDSLSADANYAMALALSRLTEAATIKEKLQLVGDIHRFATMATGINPDHRKALYTLGKWHMEVSSLGVAPKAALKMAVKDLPEASLEQAIVRFERVRNLAPGFIANLLALAEAYKAGGRSDKAIPVLERLVKLPPVTQDDPGYKDKARKLLTSLY
jgi:tetratricopeptide (TPR) repeat protein